MQLVETVDIISSGSFPESALWKGATRDVQAAIAAADWPPGTGTFSLNPTPGTDRQGRPDRHPNGVLPIKVPVLGELERRKWVTESLPPMPEGELLTTGDLDALLTVRGRRVGFEWETGNVSSSHRAISKLLDAICRETISGGILAVPVRAMQRYLTDRVGNFEELQPYFRFWSRYPVPNGVLRIYGVSHDTLDKKVPHLPKGNSGRALG
ncbi:MAG: hypothetical protein U0R52_10035 [Solirubrobacterales bacterium]